MALDNKVTALFEEIVGPQHFLRTSDEMAPYLTEWRDHYCGKAAGVLRPANTGEVSAIMKIVYEYGLSLVPQGGNTGLVGAQIPDDSGTQLILSLGRMNKVRALDPVGNTVVVDAGVILEKLHEVVDQEDRLFPLTLGAKGSCQIGGNLSTNAGGTAVLAYGNAKDLVLGLEIVLADGRIWDGLRSLRKDNTGYDLKQLFLGAEGTLGIITGASLRLFPKPIATAVAFVGVETPHNALTLKTQVSKHAGAALTGFELMPRLAIDLVLDHVPGHRDPLDAKHPWYVLVELSQNSPSASMHDALEAALSESFEAGTLIDAAIATSEAQAKDFWSIRHSISEAQKKEGPSIKHDVAVPVADTATFLDKGIACVLDILPNARPCAFGHLGDGNIHFNISEPQGMGADAFYALRDEMNEKIHGLVIEMNGSVSAEHGIGIMKRALLKQTKSDVELQLMQQLKAALDPKGLLNPGKIL